MRSLSARRAWIEIVAILSSGLLSVQVALRKESVDRNGEIIVPGPPVMVALRKESVDRNIGASYGLTAKIGRSPQGERG